MENDLEVDKMAEKDKYADEVMSDAELDNVAGGTFEELADDHKFLCDHSLLRGYDFIIGLPAKFSAQRVKEAWAKAGITCDIDYSWKGGRNNTYTDSSGNPISREEAYNIVRERFPKN